MKPFAKAALSVAALLGLGAIVAPAQEGWIDQWYRAKFGRTSPKAEAREKAERDNTAYREEAKAPLPPANHDWQEQFSRAKFGRPTPMTEARQKAERDSTAYRAEPEPAKAPAAKAPSWSEQLFRAKWGIAPPKPAR